MFYGDVCCYGNMYVAMVIPTPLVYVSMVMCVAMVMLTSVVTLCFRSLTPFDFG